MGTAKGKHRSTIVDVARRAGVSTATVSLVLNGKADQLRIADVTLKKVRLAAEELNYAPNLLLQSVRRKRTHILSFYSAFRNRESNDLYMDKLSSAVEYAGGQFGYDVLVHCNFSRSVRDTYRFLNGGWADGLILFAPLPDDPLLPLLRECRLPTVLINARDSLGVLHSIKDDVQTGMCLVVENLVAEGHTRIAMSEMDDTFHRDSRDRRVLLEQFLAARGIPLPTEYVVSGERPFEALQALMQLPKPPTAVFAWHDRLAYRLLECAERLGISVPDQLSIVGYDGLRWPGATSHLAASVRIDMYDEALTAVRILDEAIHGRLEQPVEAIVPTEFVRGTTIGPSRICFEEKHEP